MPKKTYSYKHRKSAFNAKRDDTDVLWGKVYYARVQEPLTEINGAKGRIEIENPRFEATLAFVDQADQEYVEEILGVDTRKPSDNVPHPHLKMTRLAKMDKDNKNKPVLLDEKGEYLPDDLLIGNESDVSAFVHLTQNKDGSKTYANLVGLQVFNLVEYNPNESTGSETSSTPKKKTGTSGKKKPF